MTNYGSLAILELLSGIRKKVPSADEATLRWLIALETFPADADGWRFAGAPLLANLAHLAYSTSRVARDRLITAGVIEYRPGKGRGHRSSYRFRAELKVPTIARHLSVMDDAPKGAETGGLKVPTLPDKGAEHNPLTSENASIALEAFALGTSALETPEKFPPIRKAKNQAPAALDELLDRFRRQAPGKFPRETP